ncbi:hypothetical protein BCON_0073g00280 [Botryotinia convoluta]|uniref:Uncharacterized protein n=1 Tax=Botryotinia convoluta TaxID=54673 RepID=A0A4Z1I7W5_9HELO|nr:hypothetical protein BCON_0073g00280 [Botryotinia convoluta]
MTDFIALVALIVALIALVVAVFQLAQQLMATGYVVRKCDSVVSGGVIRGGTRKFHWKQYCFTVKYQAVTFASPMASAPRLPLKIPMSCPKNLKIQYGIALKAQNRNGRRLKKLGYLLYNICPLVCNHTGLEQDGKLEIEFLMV